MMWYWGNGVHWWAWLGMTVGMVAFFGFIVWAVWYPVTTLGRQHDQRADPKQILDERLARGEIDADEYTRLHDLLGRGSTARSNEGRTPVGTGGRS
jgi:putative membrane protein